MPEALPVGDSTRNAWQARVKYLPLLLLLGTQARRDRPGFTRTRACQRTRFRGASDWRYEIWLWVLLFSKIPSYLLALKIDRQLFHRHTCASLRSQEAKAPINHLQETKRAVPGAAA